MIQIAFSFSDLIAGYVRSCNRTTETFTVETSDGREFPIKLTATTYAEVIHNLGESYIDCTDQRRDVLVPGQYLFASDVFYPEAGTGFEAKHLVFPDRSDSEFFFEKQDWWLRQIRQLGNFFAWHDRKAWWQQEQGILAYLLKLADVVAAQPSKFIANLRALQSMSSVAARALIFAKQKLAVDEPMIIAGANDSIKAL